MLQEEMKKKLPIALASFTMWIGILLASMLILFTSFGCSYVEAISNETENIDNLSQSSEERFVKILDISDVKEIDVEAEHGIIEQQAIQNSVSEIRQVLPRVEDKDPSWMVLLGRLSFAGILIAIIILIWQTGIGTLIRRLLYSVTFFIPRKSRRDAEMDLKIADEKDDMDIREAIASKRSSDPAYNAAYEKLKKKEGD
jgi:hypothetical protein